MVSDLVYPSGAQINNLGAYKTQIHVRQTGHMCVDVFSNRDSELEQIAWYRKKGTHASNWDVSGGIDLVGWCVAMGTARDLL